jgi:photosystem II stability/assembly factor-like uncharacterized protein
MFFLNTFIYTKRYKAVFIFFITFYTLCITACRPIDNTVQTEIIDSHTIQNLYEVVFSTPDTGFIFGGKRFGIGIISSTSNAGKTWRTDSICNAALCGATVQQRKSITSIGQNGRLIWSADGGITWSLSNNYLWKFMQDIAHFSSTRMVAVGGESYGSGVRATYENGTRLLSDTIDHELHSVAVANATTAVAVGYGYVCRTTDAAQTWQRLDVRGDNFQSIHFPTPEIGYIVGLSGSLWRTDDAGATWTRLRDGNDVFTDGEFRGVFFTDSNNGFVCGDKGLLWRTNDAGKTWLKIANLPKINLNKVFFMGKTGFVVGDGGVLVKITVA